MPLKQHCLRWNDHQPNFISAFSSLLTCEALVDVTLAAEGSYIQAHKVVLSACSSYFQTLFTVNPCQHPIVILKDVQFADLKVVIDFMYNGEVNVSQEQLSSILKTAEMLKIKGLVEIALDHLVSKHDSSLDRAELVTQVEIQKSLESGPKPTIPSSPCLSPSRRRKRARKSSTGSGSCSREQPPDEQQSTDNELFACNVEGTVMKMEPDNFTSNESWGFEILQDVSQESFKEEIPDFESDQVTLHLPKYESSSGVESTSMDIPGPSNASHEFQSEEQDPSIEIEDITDTPNLSLLPEKSKKKYEFVYQRFKDWCEKKKETEVTENLLLTYFSEQSKKLNSASLWCEYSMIKTSLAVKEQTDIRKFSKLTTFLKRKAVGYRPKKSKILNREQFYKFLTEAPDEKYLMMKVAAIISIAGACNMSELQNMKVDDVEEIGSALVIKIPKSKNTKPRSFYVSGSEDDLNMIDIYRKYAALRRRNTSHNRLFVQYRQGNCSVQVVGVNSFSKIPSEIAKYLGLENPTDYTGHCFRRSSAALLVNTAGTGIFSLKRIRNAVFKSIY